MGKLSAIVTQGKVYGIDHSTESVAMAMRTNKQWIDIARVEVREASVPRLPFSDGAFDVITAVETHFWWPALPTDLFGGMRTLFLCSIALMPIASLSLYYHTGYQPAVMGLEFDGTIWCNTLIQFQFFALGAMAAILLRGREFHLAGMLRLTAFGFGFV